MNKETLFTCAVLRHNEEKQETEIIKDPFYAMSKDEEILRKKLLIECEKHKDHIEEIEILVRPF